MSDNNSVLPRTTSLVTKLKEMMTKDGFDDGETYIASHIPTEIARCFMMDIEIERIADIRRIARALWEMCSTDDYELWNTRMMERGDKGRS